MEYNYITRMVATVGGYFGPNYIVEVNFLKGEMSWKESQSTFLEPSQEVHVRIVETDVHVLKEELRSCHILSWNNQYVNYDIVDGTEWSLDLRIGNKRRRMFGSNEYPEEWERFCGILKKWTGKPFE